MTSPADPELLVPRTCTTLNENDQTRAAPLAEFRDVAAYVLLGDPGAGKTRSFEHEAAVTGGHYVRARDFATLDPRPELADKTLFIDGLDEMRAGGGDGRGPLDHIRRRLDRLGRPRFRLSCRAADWYGDSDCGALREVTPEGSLRVLHLDPLSDTDIVQLLERKFAVSAPADFVRQAERHGLADLLRNPQTLGLLATAVRDSAWPNSRDATYDLACRQLARESNPEHRVAQRDTAPTTDTLLEAAGYLCALQLLAGIAGFSLDDHAADSEHVLWRDHPPPCDLPLQGALASGLFNRDEREQQRIPVHRSIAEYLGARYLATSIDSLGLPLGRIVALLAGDDGGIIPDLRGLAAWLAVHCRAARAELIERDPLGVVLHGDVRGFPTDDKRRVLAALNGEAERYAEFRFEDWTAAPFGALATPDMLPVFLKMLASPSRAEADIALLDCVLDALRFGPPVAQLATANELPRLDAVLDTIARDASYPVHIRQTALSVSLRDPPRNAARLLGLARDIQAGTIVDKDDELLGRLLTELFPEFIPAEKVFDFLHREKHDRLIGTYRMFWSHRFPDEAPSDLLPGILDQLAHRRPMVYETLDSIQAAGMTGSLLARGLESHGDAVDDIRLYEWLSTGLDKDDYPHLDGEQQIRIAAWLAERPERYKAMLRLGAQRCAGEKDITNCLFNAESRLYRAEPPADIVPWYLDRAAAESHTELKHHFFSEAARLLTRQGGEERLTLDALDRLGPWIQEHPEFETDLERFTSCRLDDWRGQYATRRRKRDKDREQRKEDWRNHFRMHLDAIREGSAHPQNLYELAQVYLLGHYEIDGETPRERLVSFLGEDEELIEAAYAGFRRALDRGDLPSVAEIVELESKGHMHLIRQPCLAGMKELHESDPEAALQLDDEVLRKLLAFRLTWGIGEDDEWFAALVRMRPALVAEVLIAYALPLLRKGKEHLQGIWPLAHDSDYAAVARLALPDILKRFPLRAKNQLLRSALDPLLKAALCHLQRPALATIVSARLAQVSMSAAQRVYWLACGLMISPADYEMALAAHIGASNNLRAHLAAFLHDHGRRTGLDSALPESSLALLIELLAPDSPPERPVGAHWVSPAMHTADEVRGFIDALGRNPSDEARQHLERLLASSQLAAWHDRLRHAAHTQRIARRKAGARRLGPAEIRRTLANREPANAADLAALAEAHLRDLARGIRDGSTNDYRQYWSYDASGKPDRPKPENDCRDMLLSDLSERLGRLGVDAIKEGYFAEDKRADIRISFGGAGGFNVPIEIKKDSHRNLWRAIREQLIPRYTRDPGADGFGIYLVFWFGGKNMPLHEGGKPRSGAELEQRLRSMLTTEEAAHIAIVVIDCALPVHSRCT